MVAEDRQSPEDPAAPSDPRPPVELAASLLASEQRFRLLVEQVRDYAIIALDTTGTIESWNTGAERLKGYRADEAVGRHFSAFYTPEDRERDLPGLLLRRARDDGRVEHRGWRVRQDGSRFWGDVTITALHDDTGSLTGFVKVTRDLTESKRLQEAQESFLAAFAHDFRTPITALKGFAELLQDAPPERHADYLSRLVDNADRLLTMMDELVDYTTLHTPPATYVPESLDLAEVLHDVVADLSSILDTDRVELRVPERRSEGRCLADRSSLHRVFTNLVKNALTYAAHGPVVVEVALDADRVRTTVSDQGRGIAPEDLPRIFDEYHRGRLAEPDGGSGLGLSSVKHLLQGQGGRVGIDSELDRGTVVTVDLPAAPSEPDAG